MANLVQLRLELNELSVFRWTLRFLSLWSPREASLAEKVFYPLVVNVLLLIVITSDIYGLVKVTQSWKSLEPYVFFAIDLGMYSSHLFGVAYFRSRDLEDNMIDLEVDLVFMEELRKKLRRLTIGIIISYLLLVATVLLFFNIETWTQGHFLCNSSFSFLHGGTSHFVCMLNYPTNIYGVGNSLAISWTMCLFQQICCARLQKARVIYLRWTQSTEEAICSHLEDYSRKVKKSCSHLAKWFVAHNLILIIATPVLFADIIKEFREIPRSKPFIHPSLFVGFLIYTVVIWIAPLYFAELLQVHDETFCSAVNEFCPCTLSEELQRERDENENREMGENETRELGENGNRELGENETRELGENETRELGENETRELGENETRELGENETRELGENENRELGENENRELGENETRELGENETRELGENETRELGENENRELGENETRELGENETRELGENENRELGENETPELGENENRELGKNENRELGENETRELGENETRELGENETRELGKNENRELGENETRELGENETRELGENETRELGKNENREMGENETRELGENETRELGENETRELGENENRELGENENRELGENENRELGENETRELGENETRELGENENRELGENENRELGENEFTFQSRTEVNKFLSYLNNRKTGFLMGSYSFQLKLAMLSIFLAVLSFTLRFTFS